MGIERSGNGIPLYPSGDYKVYSDTDFVSGDSPIVLNARVDLGHDANNGNISCFGPGAILVSFTKGSAGSADDQFTLNPGDSCDIMGEGVSKITITHSGVDSAYEVFVE